MTRFADPGRCPDCGAPLDPGSSLVCPRCRLDLSGPLGQKLFAALTEADRLLESMRSRATSAVPAGGVSAPAYAAATADLSVGSRPVTDSALPPPLTVATTVRPSSVPKILLGLGAVCLLVAALVFLAVTWSLLGVGGRTLVLVVMTAAAGALTSWVAGRGLRGATEALGAVTLGLVALDVSGANNAGWLGNPADSTFAALLGLVLVGSGLAGHSLLRRTPARGFLVGELTVALGSLLVWVGLVSGDWGTPAGRALFGLVATAGVAVLAALLPRLSEHEAERRQDLVAPVGTAGVAVFAWLGLVVAGLDLLGEAPTLASVWGDLDGWPLVAAAAAAAGVAAARGLPLRLGAANLALVPAVAVLLAPLFDEPAARLTLGITLAVAGLSAAVWLVPRPWGRSPLAALGLCSAYLAVQLTALVGNALAVFLDLTDAAWSGAATTRLDAYHPPEGFVGGWWAPVLTVALLAAAAAVARSFGARLTTLGALAPVILALALGSIVVALLLAEVPVWTVVAVSLALVVALTALAVRSPDEDLAGLVGLLVLGATLLVSCYAAPLTLTSALVGLACVAAYHLLTPSQVRAEVAGGLACGLLALTAWSLGAVLDADQSWSAAAGLLALGALALTRSYLPIGRAAGSTGVEVGALLAALPLAAAGVAHAADPHQATWLAVYLTEAGVVATALALLRPDRRRVAWLGGLLLAAATWVRLLDLGVTAPEPYTLPSATVLLAAGWFQLRRHPETSTLRAWGAGLALALVPSLLWVLDDPTSGRALVLGLACLALVVAGVRLRWAAPLVFGAAVGLLVVLREAAPYADAVPRWSLIGLAGVLLIALGVTWEARLADARRGADYLRALR